ncbi:MAG: MBL fold metallo-hydrolase, partial [Anaerolineales bacterium]|nr:MBL fold metallo-hydrolase [Anaerolineales bacterium]
VVVYGSDGSPSLEIQALAQGADILVHEATGLYPAHSSAEQAAEVARAAGVKRLILVHLSPLENDLAEQQAAAARIFGGPVFLGEDLERFEF